MIELQEWKSIYKAIERARRPNELVQGVVIDRDEAQQVIYLKEFGAEPIPMVSLDYSFASYATNGGGLVRRTVTAAADLPAIGDIVLVGRIGGRRRLPRCLGILRQNRPWQSPDGNELVVGASEVFNVKDFGAKNGGDGTQAILDAIDAAKDNGAGTVWFPAGWDLYFEANLLVDAPYIRFEGGPGVRLLQGGDFSVQFFGAQGSGTSLSANAVKGDRVISVTTTGFSAGDWVEISSNAAWPLVTGASVYGEIARIKSIDSGSQLTLHSPLRSGPYNTADTAKIYKNTMLEGSGIGSNIEIVNPTPGTLTSPAVNARWLFNSQWDMTARSIDGSGLALNGCVGAFGIVRAYDLTDDTANNRFGYGVNFVNATCDIDGLWIYAEKCRHGATTGISSVGKGVPRNITYRGVAKDCSAAGWDTHAEGEHITYAGKVVSDSGDLSAQGFGVQVRAPNCRISAVTEITGLRTHGIRIKYDPTAGSGENGINCQIDDGVWIHDLAVASANGIHNSGASGVRIGKVRFENISGTAIVNDTVGGTGQVLLVDRDCAYISVGSSTGGSASALIDRLGQFGTVGITVSGGGNFNLDSRSTLQRFVVGDANNFTIQKNTSWAPQSSLIVVEIFNNSGGAMGTVTFDTGVFRQTGFTSPANGKYKTGLFQWESSLGRFILVGQWSADL